MHIIELSLQTICLDLIHDIQNLTASFGIAFQSLNWFKHLKVFSLFRLNSFVSLFVGVEQCIDWQVSAVTFVGGLGFLVFLCRHRRLLLIEFIVGDCDL
jgi:hypothetical protein